MAYVRTTTTHAVRMHGWTLPAGAEVFAKAIQLPIKEWGQQVSTVTVAAPDHSEFDLGLPITAVKVLDLGDVPMFRYDDATGRSVEVSVK